jgi:large subunit ribosomal protein L25
METRELEINLRESTGKGDSGRLKRTGVIPAVFYGPGKKAIPIIVNPNSLLKAIDTEAGINTLIKFRSSGSELNDKVVIMKDKQLHPVTRKLVHVDFYEIDLAKKIEVAIPVVCSGKAKGIELGGILQIVQREIMVECLPTQIPEKIEIEVTELEIGDSIHIKDITPPSGVTFKYDTNFTIVTVATPMKEEEVKPAVTAEGVPVEGAVPAEGAEGAAPAAEGAAAPAPGGKEGAKPGAPADKGKAPSAAPAKGAPAKAPEKGKGQEKK